MVRFIVDLFQTGTVHFKYFGNLIFKDGKYRFIDTFFTVFGDKDEVVLEIVSSVTVAVCFQVHKRASNIVEPIINMI